MSVELPCDCAETGRCTECHGFTTGLPYGHSCSCSTPESERDELADKFSGFNPEHIKTWGTSTTVRRDRENKKVGFVAGWDAREFRQRSLDTLTEEFQKKDQETKRLTESLDLSVEFMQAADDEIGSLRAQIASKDLEIKRLEEWQDHAIREDGNHVTRATRFAVLENALIELKNDCPHKGLMTGNCCHAAKVAEKALLDVSKGST
jgi:hypothetical protein